MKKILVILSVVVFSAACAEKKEVFDASTAFRTAEEDMQAGKYEKARKAYQEIQEKTPERTYDPALMLRIADTYYGEEKYEEALVEYRSFLNYHPANKDAAYVQFQIAMCSFKQLTTIDRDPELTRTALREFRALLAKYRNSGYEEQARERIEVCIDRLAQYENYVARYYRKKGAYAAAAGRYEKLLADYPGSTVEKDSLYEAADVYLKLGDRQKARALAETLERKYPSMTSEAASILKQAGAAAP